MHIQSAIFALLTVPVVAFSQVEALGTVIDGASELPVPKVRIFSSDSTFLTSSDAQGRWELRVARPIEVTFRKEGYRDNVVALSDFADLLDIVIELEPMGSVLEGRVVKGKGASRTIQAGSIAAIEAVSGMRMDLQEHLRNLPGVSGVREFSSEVSVYGSRTHDVSHVLGPFQIPNLRHLDFSFPGNQSVLNPRVLQGITVEHDPTKGPLEQGLASALRYQPLRPATDRYDGIISWGLANRELDLFGPIGNGTFTASGRWLAPSTLNHMSDRFFVGERESGNSKDSVPVAVIDLQAFDGYARVEQGFGPFATSFTALGSSDDHSVSLDAHITPTTRRYFTIQQGTKLDFLAFMEAQGQLPFGWTELYGGGTFANQTIQYSDTLQRDVIDWGGNNITFPPDMMDWAANTLDKSDWRLGGSIRFDSTLFGMEPEILAAVDYIDQTREFGKTFRFGLGSEVADTRRQFKGNQPGGHPWKDDLTYLRSRSSLRLRAKQDKMEWGFAAGGLYAQDAGWGTEATASWMGPVAGFGILANASLRSNETVEAVEFGKQGVRQVSSLETKFGAGRSIGPFEVSGTVYWRSIDKPELPRADFLWLMPQGRKATDATVLGGTLQAKWTSWHTLQFQTNLSRVQGDYDFADGSTMEWEANREFDAWTLLKYHPRTDTLVAVILSHSASLGKPYYRYRLDTLSGTISVETDPTASQGARVRDQYRTDVRAELGIPTNLAPFRLIRFYAEVQNIFGQFEGDWARVLGGTNYRARSWTPIHSNGSDGSIVRVDPLYASGTDLFFSFGIEGRLGI